MNNYFIKQRIARDTFKKSNGAALLIMLGILLIALTTVAISRLSLNKIAIERGDVTATALGQAREALLGYAVRVQLLGVTDLPLGTLPCPDTNNDGASNFNATTGVCTSQRGLLPYVTLGLPELRDGSGALLWYAV